MTRSISLVILSLLISVTLVGQNFYVHPNGNDDNNSGTSESAPWATLQKVADEIGGLIPIGSTVHFAAGETFEGGISVTWPTVMDGITFTKYPSTGPNPRFTPRELVSSAWTPLGNNIWSTPLSTTYGHVHYLYDDGVLQTKARYPDLDPLTDNDWLRLTSMTLDNNNFSIDLTGEWNGTFDENNWQGAEIVMRTSNWSYNRATIEESISDVLKISNPLLNFPIDQIIHDQGVYAWGFFIEGHLDALNTDNEWFYDDVNEVLYYKPEEIGQPSNIAVTLFDGDHFNGPFIDPIDGRLDHEIGIEVPQGSSGVTIEYIDFMHYPSRCIGIYDSEQITVKNCNFSDSYAGISDSDDGEMTPYGGREQIFHSNSFQRIYNRALETSSDATDITNNIFTDIALVPGLGLDSWGYQGLISRGIREGEGELAQGKIMYNTFTRIGYTAMELNGSPHVQYNSVNDALQILNDGGGIQIDFCDGLLLDQNIVNRVGDPSQNMESVAKDYHAYHQLTYGIYFGDKYIKNTTASNNVVTGCDKGIHVDHTGCSVDDDVVFPNVTVSGNTFFNNRVQMGMTDNSIYQNCESAHLSSSHYACDCLDGNGDLDAGQGTAANYKAEFYDKYEDNIMYCLSSEQRCMEQGHTWSSSFDGPDDLVDYGTFDNNYYFNPFNPVVVYVVPKFPSDCPDFSNHSDSEDTFVPNAVIPYTLSGWQQKFTEDANSSSHPLRMLDYQVTQDMGTVYSVTADPVWMESSSECQGCDYSLQQNYLRSINCDYIERWCNFCNPEVDPTGIPAGLYEFTFKLRSPNTDAMQFCPTYDASVNQLLDPSYIPVPSDFEEQRLLKNIQEGPIGDVEIFAAFQNSQFAMGGLSTSEIDIEYVEMRSVVIDPDYLQTFSTPFTVGTDGHILHFNNPLATDEYGVPIAYEALVLEGCWSDVLGNQYASGETITLQEWESRVLFRIEPTYYIDVAEHHIPWGAVETWDTDRNIRGSIIIENGGQLYIDNGAVIGFDDSRQGDEVLTNIVVEPGGYLNIGEGATLTTIPGCGNRSMWDGIKVLGNDPEHPGRVVVSGGATIENALTAILSGDGDPETPGVVSTAHGGEVSTHNASFLNNKHDIVFLDFPGPGPQQGYALSGLYLSQFKTTDPLQYEDVDPVVHVRTAENANMVQINSCLFANDLPSHNESDRMGNGVE